MKKYDLKESHVFVIVLFFLMIMAISSDCNNKSEAFPDTINSCYKTCGDRGVAQVTPDVCKCKP